MGEKTELKAEHGQEPLGCPCPGACSMKGPLSPNKRASIICDFMGWCKDGAAWQHAHKLATLLAQPTPQDQGSNEGKCFECGQELHAPFCPACNPEMTGSLPDGWRPGREAVFLILSDYGQHIRDADALEVDPVADPYIARILALPTVHAEKG